MQVTNRDECVSVKSPSHHALVENLVCNQAGSGISIGSLNVSAEISNIVRTILQLAPSPNLCLLVNIGSTKYQHHPGQQYRIHQNIPWRIWICDQCHFREFPVSRESLRS